MVRVPRRRMIRDMGLALVSLIPHNAVKSYRVDFLCHSKTEKDFEKYIELQPNWENVKAINEITERYKRAGEILSVEFSESKERLEHKWSYVFASRKSFVSWNREIFFGGRFNRMKIPSTYKHQIIEQFIS